MFLEGLSRSPGTEWTLEGMAAQCGLGRSRFAHYCRQITNMTPMEFLIRRRVDAAARMLRGEPRRRITDIAFAAGFQSSQHFATTFRKLKGAAPRDYRKTRNSRTE